MSRNFEDPIEKFEDLGKYVQYVYNKIGHSSRSSSIQRSKTTEEKDGQKQRDRQTKRKKRRKDKREKEKKRKKRKREKRKEKIKER